MDMCVYPPPHRQTYGYVCVSSSSQANIQTPYKHHTNTMRTANAGLDKAVAKLEAYKARYPHVSYAVRDLLQCQKRPTTVYQARGVQGEVPARLLCGKRPTTVSKETYYSVPS
jgi:hypothetical protein